MIFRRVAILLFGIVLALILGFFMDYQLEKHTRNGRLTKQIIMLGYETTMTDAQIAHAIGDDPMRILRRASWMEYAEELVVGLIVGIFVACFEKRIPGRMTALILVPYIFFLEFWHFKRLPAAAVAKMFGINAACLAAAILVSVAVARLFSRRTRFAAIQQEGSVGSYSDS